MIEGCPPIVNVSGPQASEDASLRFIAGIVTVPLEFTCTVKFLHEAIGAILSITVTIAVQIL